MDGKEVKFIIPDLGLRDITASAIFVIAGLLLCGGVVWGIPGVTLLGLAPMLAVGLWLAQGTWQQRLARAAATMVVAVIVAIAAGITQIVTVQLLVGDALQRLS